MTFKNKSARENSLLIYTIISISQQNLLPNHCWTQTKKNLISSHLRPKKKSGGVAATTVRIFLGLYGETRKQTDSECLCIGGVSSHLLCLSLGPMISYLEFVEYLLI